MKKIVSILLIAILTLTVSSSTVLASDISTYILLFCKLNDAPFFTLNCADIA